ncbi:MAG: hypothetical protein KGD67_11610, partial [Candidatus Lokiarchaeota archaeon]|nr:hypothetical protein [Candidatus Lokiarchaeota archaeon]
MNTEKEEKKSIIRGSRANDYKTIFVHQFYGGVREDHFEMIVESLESNAAESQIRKEVILELKDEVGLKMTPEQAKRLYLWLGKQITIFEKNNREIKIPDQVAVAKAT